MSQSWTTGIDRVAMTTLERGVRTLAVAAPHRSAGVSTIAARLAEASHLAGRSTLLLVLQSAVPVHAAPTRDDRSDALSIAIEASEHGYDLALVVPDAKSRALLSSPERVRTLLQEQFAAYSSIILDLPPLVESSPRAINSAAAAAACDGILLVALTSRTRREDLTAARSLLDMAGARVSGLVMNDLAAPTLGAEVAREMARIERLLPRVARWGAQKALGSPLLNRV